MPAIKYGSLSVLGEIHQERNRQDDLWGAQNHTPEVWHLILAEEFGEVAKALNEWFFRRKEGSWDEARAELIQTAAVCVAMVESMDRNRGRQELP